MTAPSVKPSVSMSVQETEVSTQTVPWRCGHSMGQCTVDHSSVDIIYTAQWVMNISCVWTLGHRSVKKMDQMTRH